MKQKKSNKKQENDESIETPADVTVEVKPDEMETLRAQCAEYMDMHQRLGAEFDNFRKRTMKEKAGMYDDGFRDAVTAILPILDSLERAVASVDAGENAGNPLYKGLAQIARQLGDVLESKGVSEIKSCNEPFNPNLHAAVAHDENPEFGANTVSEVLMKGYMYKDRVVRHSMVRVSN
jgi:molecular chaperone GrpE